MQSSHQEFVWCRTRGKSENSSHTGNETCKGLFTPIERVSASVNASDNAWKGINWFQLQDSHQVMLLELLLKMPLAKGSP